MNDEITTALIIISLIIVAMIFISSRFGYYRRMFKMIIFSDKIDTSLNRSITVRKYEKLFKTQFRPYLMSFTSNINEDIFYRFTKFTEEIKESNYEQPFSLHIVFLNKIDGYIRNNEDDSYEFFIKGDFIPFITTDKKNIELVDEVMNLSYRKLNEFNIDGAIKLNKKFYFLSSLTSISSYENIVKDKTYSELVFNFGATTESIRFNSFEDAYKYLFDSDESDIRLIQKISNTSLIDFKKKEDKQC